MHCMRVQMLLMFLGSLTCQICYVFSDETCPKGSESCKNGHKSATLSAELAGLIADLFTESQEYSTDLDQLKSLMEIADKIRKLQPQTKDILPKRKSDEKAIEELKKWVQKRYKPLAEAVEARIFPGMGFGLVAARDIADKETIATINVTQVVSTQELSHDFECLGRVKVKQPKYDNAWKLVNLTAILLREMFNPNSKFRPYLDILPIDFVHPVFFNHQEIKLLEGSVVLEGSIHTIHEIFGMYAKLWQHLLSRPECSKKIGIPLEKLTLDAFRWSFITSLSRNYDGSFLYGQSNNVLIPLWDLFNHRDDADVDTYNEYTGPHANKPKGTYKTYALRPVKKGQQIFMHYMNPLDPIEAFSTWGFILVNELTIGIIFDDTSPDSHKQNEILAKLDWDDSITIYHPNPTPGSKKKRLVSIDALQGLIDIVSGVRQADITPNAVRKAWQFLASQIEHQMEILSGSMKQNNIQQVLNDKTSVPNIKMAAGEVMAEFNLLKSCLAHIRNVLVK